MSPKIDVWHFIESKLGICESVALLIVAESSGSSPGRAGYKMAVAADGEFCGSIGGGIMEVSMVEQAKAALSEPGAIATGLRAAVIREQVHQKNAPNASGMICSGRQTVIFQRITATDLEAVNSIVEALKNRTSALLTITADKFAVESNKLGTQIIAFEKESETEFAYHERIGSANELVIIGGGHCALALSELMSKLDFRIRIFDERPDLSTLGKNEFADEITIIDGYENIAQQMSSGDDFYVVVMTIGYRSDEIVIRQLLDRDFKYFGVLGSKAKMATLMKELTAEGLDSDRLAAIHTPIGLQINSRTPEEIAISIAAEIISVKNA